MDALFAKATDFFLFRGDFGRLCTVWAFGYCLSAALAARAKNGKANFFKGTALTTLGAYGGQMCVSLCLGNRSAMFDNENYILFAAIAWVLSGRSEVTDVLSSFPAQIYMTVASELMRCHIMIQCFNAGVDGAGSASNWYPVTFICPIACGVLGGLGGAFLPLSNGINSLDTWGNDWSSKSALLFNGWLQLVLRDPNVGPRLAGMVACLGNADCVKGSAIGFMVLAPILYSFAPDLPNPLGVEASLDTSDVGGGGGGRKRSTSPKRK